MKRVIDGGRGEGALLEVNWIVGEEADRCADGWVVALEALQIENAVGSAALRGRDGARGECADVAAVGFDGFAMLGERLGASKGRAKWYGVGNEEPVARRRESDAAFVAGCPR